jgi:hypothetical protein
MSKKFFTNLLLCCFFLSSIPDSLGCANCWGKPANGAANAVSDRVFDLEASKTEKSGVKAKRPAPGDQNGSPPCHFCLSETFANPGGYCLPDLTMFPGTGPVIVSKTVEPVFPISQPPEPLSSFLL